MSILSVNIYIYMCVYIYIYYSNACGIFAIQQIWGWFLCVLRLKIWPSFVPMSLWGTFNIFQPWSQWGLLSRMPSPQDDARVHSHLYLPHWDVVGILATLQAQVLHFPCRNHLALCWACSQNSKTTSWTLELNQKLRPESHWNHLPRRIVAWILKSQTWLPMPASLPWPLCLRIHLHPELPFSSVETPPYSLRHLEVKRMTLPPWGLLSKVILMFAWWSQVVSKYLASW